jgi:hypothetical protein
MTVSDILRLVSLTTGIAAILYARRERRREDLMWADLYARRERRREDLMWAEAVKPAAEGETDSAATER